MAEKNPKKELSETQESMVEIRCPFYKTSKKGVTYLCNRLCVKVEPQSTGEAWCYSCKLSYSFEVGDSAKTFVRVQRA